MKIIFETPPDGEEDTIIIRCHVPDDAWLHLAYAMQSGRTRLTGYDGKNMVQLYLRDIYYFEAVDNKVFACCEQNVYEIRKRLYELEEAYRYADFLRISKSVVVNTEMIASVSPMLGARLEARLRNGERVIISRQYVSDLKRKFGLAER